MHQLIVHSTERVSESVTLLDVSNCLSVAYLYLLYLGKLGWTVQTIVMQTSILKLGKQMIGDVFGC